MLHYAVLSTAVVETCHRSGAAVWTWTVNEPALLERVVGLGVDGVTSDDPRLFLQFSA
jgi:glycerophosphoryl diester phosphodiesterase